MGQAGERDLQVLLRSMAVSCSEEAFVFASFPRKRLEDLCQFEPLGLFWEDEGLTAILSIENAAKAGVVTDPSFRRISLSVHSSLEAVGLTAAITGALAKDGISANVVAGYFHDHIFVPERNAETAMRVLERLSSGD